MSLEAVAAVQLSLSSRVHSVFLRPSDVNVYIHIMYSPWILYVKHRKTWTFSASRQRHRLEHPAIYRHAYRVSSGIISKYAGQCSSSPASTTKAKLDGAFQMLTALL